MMPFNFGRKILKTVFRDYEKTKTEQSGENKRWYLIFACVFAAVLKTNLSVEPNLMKLMFVPDRPDGHCKNHSEKVRLSSWEEFSS